MKRLLPCLLTLCFSLPATAEVTSEISDQTGLSITIYNRDLALIRDRRQVDLPRGITDLAIRGVSGQLQAETALLESLGDDDLQVMEQNFNYDLLTPQKLLEKYLGRRIDIVRTNPATGVETRETATVLSVEGGLVVRIGERIETNPGGRYIFREIPKNLREQPTLVTRVKTGKAGPHRFELGYLSGGLSWKADYVARLNEKETRMDLAGWVTLENSSGTSYDGARLQLVAGEVHRVQNALRDRRLRMMERSVAAAPPLSEEPLFEYHLYTLERPTTILDRQTKQVALLSAGSVPVDKEYLLEGVSFFYQARHRDPEQKQPVGVWLRFHNSESAGLGMPLPAGIVRVYKADSRGNLQFLGEDRIDHTPRDEEVRLKLGRAFDITATRIQTDYRKRNYGHPYSSAEESGYRITLKNAKEEAVEVMVREPIPGDWKILEENLPHEKISAGQAQWKVQVPARGEAVLEYRVLIRQ